MDQVRILYTHQPDQGWFFTSPDLALAGGGDATYAAAHARAITAVRFTLECEAEERGDLVPDLDAVDYVHFVAEQDAAAVVRLAA